MRVVSWKKRKANYLFINQDSIFRTHLSPSWKRKGGFVYKKAIFSNPYEYFEMITKALADATYKVKIISQDNLGNNNDGVESTVAVVGYLLPPKAVTGSMSTNTVTLSWTHSSSGAPTYYRAYGNGGSGDTIDRATLLKQVAGTVLNASFAVANGDWKFVVEAYDGSRQSVNMNTVSLTAPSDDYVPNSPGFGGTNESVNKISSIYLIRVSVGKVKIRFYWLYGTNAASFNVYHDSGTGTVSYAAPAFQFTRQAGFIQEYTTAQLHSTDVDITYKFVVRAATSTGVEDGNIDEYEIKVDGVAPDEASVISSGSIF